MSDEQVVQSINLAKREVANQITRVADSSIQGNAILRQIFEFFPKVIKSIKNGFHKLISSQAQMSIIAKATEIESLNEEISNQHEIIDRKGKLFDDNIKRSNNNFSKIIKEVVNNFENLIRNLDAHVIDINKNFFNEKSAINYEKKAIPSLNSLDKYYLDCCFIRSKEFKDLVLEIKEFINKFLSDRNSFISNIERYKINIESKQTKNCSIPIFIIKDIEEIIDLELPGKIEISESLAVNIEVLDELNNMEKALKKKEILMEKVNWKKISDTDKEKMNKDVDNIFTDFLNSNNAMAYKELHKFIDNLDIKIGK